MARNDDRRQRLADAGLAVLAREGARGLTPRALDREAGVPTGTASNYFRTRAELVRALADRIGQRLARDPDAVAGLRAGEAGPVMFAAHIRDIVRRLATDGAGLLDLTVADVRTLLAKFGLRADHVGRAVDELSPGERTRAAMALLQARGTNVLVLDEPSNHLDLPAIEQLESALESYDGAVLLVTHDRRMLQNVTVHRGWRVEGGRVTETLGPA